MIGKLKVGKPMNLSNQVAEMLIQAILEGDLKGGDQLVEAELQSLFSVSRSPLREAFRELEKKGLVDIVPRKGTFVKKVTKTDIEMQFPVRAALESLAAKLAFINNREKTANRLSRALEYMTDAVKTKDPRKYYSHHLKYHEVFIDLSGNDLLIEMLHNLRMKNLWYTLHYKYYMEDLNKSLEIHQRILEQYRDPQTDPEAIRSLVEHHINIALDKFIDYVEKIEQTHRPSGEKHGNGYG
jgi:DNA-binding GntR family transcriptional regulator